MKQKQGFTLIELLVVIGILSVLALIAAPNYMNAQTRAKVARAHADMRSLNTALEAYKVDRNEFPVACQNGTDVFERKDRLSPPYEDGHRDIRQQDSNSNFIHCYLNCNDAVIMAAWPQRETPASWRCSFSVDPSFRSLTTPVAYITTYPSDPFASTRGLIYGYSNMGNKGWILWSFGPDCDESEGGEIGEAKTRPQSGELIRLFPAVAMNRCQDWGEGDKDKKTLLRWGWDYFGKYPDMEQVGTALVLGGPGIYGPPSFFLLYHPDLYLSTDRLLVNGFTYDPTNGIRSEGDIWRIKQ